MDNHYEKHITTLLQKQVSSQQWTHPGNQVAHATDFFTVTPNTCRFSVFNLFHATVLAPRIFWWLLDFFKNSCTHDLSKMSPELRSPDPIQQTADLWVFTLPLSLQRNNGITFTVGKCASNHNLHHRHFILSRAPEIRLPKAIHQTMETGTKIFVQSKTLGYYFKQTVDLCCKYQVLLLHFSRWWSPGTQHHADWYTGTKVFNLLYQPNACY
jgi:hypothetical protein